MLNPIAPAPGASQSAARHVMPVQLRTASLVPTSYREADNTIEVVWTTGSRRRAYDWYNDQVFEEELDVSPEAVDMTRFDAGAVHVVDTHRTWGLDAVLGRAIEGSIVNGEGRARIAFSTDPAKAGVIGDIRAGIIRSMSFGYSVERYEITRAQDRTDGVNLPLYREVRWTPAELTFCAVPADPHAASRAGETAQTRSQPAHGSACEFTTRGATPLTSNQEPTMTEAELQAQRDAEAAAQRTAAEAAQRTAQEAAATAAAAAAVQRSADITDLCQRHNVPHLAAGLIRSNATLDAANSSVLAELAVRSAAGGGNTNVQVQTMRDQADTRRAGVEEALLNRCDPRQALTDNGRQYRGMSLLEIGRDWLEANGVTTRGLDRMTLAQRMLHFRGNMATREAAFHTTSDFANILANVAYKRLRMGYDENPGTYTRWARRAPNLADFKPISVVQLGAMPDLLLVNEAGEIKYGTFGDGSEKYNLLTYARIVALSRQAVINDDLRAFDRVVAGFGASAARLENRTVYAQLTGNANMADGNALFSGAHGNNGTGAGSALQFSSLVSMRTAMRTQKGLNSEELNLGPAFLIGPAALEQTMYQLTSSQYVPAQQSNVNEFRQGGRTSLDPIIEPILDGISSTAWYAAASSSQVDTVEYAYLDGAEGPVIESEVGFEVDGISFKCREDFAAKTIDWRGLYRAVGV
jgi:hypothetical protein